RIIRDGVFGSGNSCPGLALCVAVVTVVYLTHRGSGLRKRYLFWGISFIKYASSNSRIKAMWTSTLTYARWIATKCRSMIGCTVLAQSGIVGLHRGSTHL